jgi:hypothetical protein
MYRSFEREGLDQYFVNEAMFYCFIQSAIRVGKLDVVERLLKLTMQNRLTPSLEFWHTVVKMLSSRKRYQCCVNIFAMCGPALPKDKVIFSCLINAALESGMPDRALPMLELYKEGDALDAELAVAGLHQC